MHDSGFNYATYGHKYTFIYIQVLKFGFDPTYPKGSQFEESEHGGLYMVDLLPSLFVIFVCVDLLYFGCVCITVLFFMVFFN